MSKPTSSTNNSLIEAVKKGNIGLATKEILSGIDVNSRDESGRTALMIASTAGNLGMVKMLIDHNAILYLLDHKFMIARDFAIKNGHHEVAQFLLDLNLIITANIGSLDGVRKCLEDGANPNATGFSTNITPLMSAALSAQENVEVVQLLLQNHANIHATDASGFDAEKMALTRGNKKIAGMLELEKKDPLARLDKEFKKIFAKTNPLSRLSKFDWEDMNRYQENLLAERKENPDMFEQKKKYNLGEMDELGMIKVKADDKEKEESSTDIDKFLDSLILPSATLPSASDIDYTSLSPLEILPPTDSEKEGGRKRKAQEQPEAAPTKVKVSKVGLAIGGKSSK